VIENCVFSGNSGEGGAVKNYSQVDMALRNCVFVGNDGKSFGGAAFSRDASVTRVVNCTFSGNSATYGGALYDDADSVLALTNCILWGNAATWYHGQVWQRDGAGSLSIGFSDIEDGLAGTTEAPGVTTDGGGNTNVNPLLAGGTNGNWSEDSTYDSTAGQTTLTDGDAGWTPGELAGKFLSPDTAQVLQFLVETNVSTTVTVWGDASSLGTNGAPYRVQDVHLKSQYGRWDPGRAVWATDDEDSPCIDAGDPTSDSSLETGSNGGRINMGAYGNTDQASRSIPPGTIVIVR